MEKRPKSLSQQDLVPSWEQLHLCALSKSCNGLCLSGTLMALKGPCVFQEDENLQQNFIKKKTCKNALRSMLHIMEQISRCSKKKIYFRRMFLLEAETSKFHVSSPYLQSERQWKCGLLLVFPFSIPVSFNFWILKIVTDVSWEN